MIKDVYCLNGIAHHLVNISSKVSQNDMEYDLEHSHMWGRATLLGAVDLPSSTCSSAVLVLGSFLLLGTPRNRGKVRKGRDTYTDLWSSVFRKDMPDPPSKPSDPVVHHLQQPEKLSKVLKEDRYDCLSCRLVGQFNIFDLYENCVLLIEKAHRCSSG